MPGLLRRLAALATVLLSFAIVGVLVLRQVGAGVAMGPMASVSPTPTASATVITSDSPQPSASADVQAVFAQIKAQVQELRGLPSADIGPAQVIGRAALVQELRASFDRDYPQARRDADNLMLRTLGLLNPNQDVAALQLKLLSAQVIGFYDDKTRKLVVITDQGLTPEARITLAHEYTHALQDHAFGLSKLDINASGQDDRDLARLSLVEGDATESMLQWALAHLTPQELLGVSQTPTPDMSGIPAWMVEQLEFPYTTGAQFVMQRYVQGGWPAVNEVFARPPSSTEQVMHPEKYAAREQPLAVTAPALASALGTGWKAAPADTLGEAFIGFWLKGLGVSATTAQGAAAGWGGDREAAASGPNGARAVAWRIRWDSANDAQQFAAAYQGITLPGGLAGKVVQPSSTETLVVQGTSSAIVDRAIATLRLGL
jgi:hypothetical protein